MEEIERIADVMLCDSVWNAFAGMTRLQLLEVDLYVRAVVSAERERAKRIANEE